MQKQNSFKEYTKIEIECNYNSKFNIIKRVYDDPFEGMDEVDDSPKYKGAFEHMR